MAISLSHTSNIYLLIIVEYKYLINFRPDSHIYHMLLPGLKNRKP